MIGDEKGGTQQADTTGGTEDYKGAAGEEAIGRDACAGCEKTWHNLPAVAPCRLLGTRYTPAQSRPASPQAPLSSLACASSASRSCFTPCPQIHIPPRICTRMCEMKHSGPQEWGFTATVMPGQTGQSTAQGCWCRALGVLSAVTDPGRVCAAAG